jgi:phosphoribosyl 1,2-cyclic phosphate phosphodiesterase
MHSVEKINIEATLLGTGTSQGVPVIACDCDVCQSADENDKRLRSSLLLKIAGKNFVIDAGPDFRAQMLRERVNSLRVILLTHEHVDHIFGLEDIRSYNWTQKHPTDIYAEDRVLEAIKRIFHYVFADFKYPGVPEMKLHKIENKPFKIDGIEFIPIRCYHHKLPVYGFRVGDLTYITDTNFIPDEELEKVKGTKILIINALRKESHISHFNLEEALEIINEIRPEKAYLTHLSHAFGKHSDIQNELPENVFVGFDGMKIGIEGPDSYRGSD